MDTKTQSALPNSDEQELAKVLAGVSEISDDNLEFEETPVPTTYTQPENAADTTALPEPTTTPTDALTAEDVPDLPMPDITAEPTVVQPEKSEEPVVGYNPPATPVIAEPVTAVEASPSYGAPTVMETPVVGYNPPEMKTPIEKPAEEPVIGYEPQATPELPELSTGDSELDGIKQEALLELRPLVDKLSMTPEEKFDICLLLLRTTDDKTLIAPAHAAAQAITNEVRRAQALVDVVKEIDYLSNQQKAA